MKARKIGAPYRLWRYLLQLFFPSLLASAGLFTLILELIDLFANLWRYLSLNASFVSIMKVMYLYLPYCVYNTFPIALLFATAISIATLQSTNELTIIFGSSISLRRLVTPLLAIALSISLASYYFYDKVVLDTLVQKNMLSQKLLGSTITFNNSDIAIISNNGEIVWRADQFNGTENILTGLTIMERDEKGKPFAMIESDFAKWSETKWLLYNVRMFSLLPNGTWLDKRLTSWESPKLTEKPEIFQRQTRNVEEMNQRDLAIYAKSLKSAGLPFEKAESEASKRYSFSATFLIVVFLAAGLGGRFRKNILLGTLISSLLAATGYYVTQLITLLFAETGLLAPWLGAWIPFILFFAFGAFLFRYART